MRGLSMSKVGNGTGRRCEGGKDVAFYLGEGINLQYQHDVA